jgi:hypothetical protein
MALELVPVRRPRAASGHLSTFVDRTRERAGVSGHHTRLVR